MTTASAAAHSPSTSEPNMTLSRLAVFERDGYGNVGWELQDFAGTSGVGCVRNGVRLFIDEANSPVSRAQPKLARLAFQHLYVAKAGAGKPFNGFFHLVPVAVG